MNQRIDKINELIKQQLSELIFTDFPDEIVSINFIYTTNDLSDSKIFVSVASGHESVYSALRTQSGKYRKILANKLYLRKMPRLLFEKDEAVETIDRIQRILN